MLNNCKINNDLEIITTNDGSKSLKLTSLNETYHSIHGALNESTHVFINEGLNKISKKNISILEVSFGTGLNVINTIKNKLDKKINYYTIEPNPIKLNLYNKLGYNELLQNKENIFLKIHKLEWGKKHRITNNFHLTKIKTSIQLFKSRNKFDIIYYDAFSPNKQPEMWTENILKKCYKKLNKNGLFVTYCSKGNVKRILCKLNFKVEKIQGPLGKREMIRGVKI
tara:strand:- start:449 stop:1123 length:675 start_codon:yes stop_codon:yes gene_type:complete